MNTENYRDDFKPTSFQVDASDRILEGYGFIGDNWNGWACPYLPFEAMQTLSEIYSDDVYWTIFFNAQKHCWVFYDHLQTDENGNAIVHEIGATTINGIEVFKAHELCWCFYPVLNPDSDERIKSFDIRYTHTFWYTATIEAISAEDAEKKVELAEHLPEEFHKKLSALEKEFGLDFCDSEIQVMGAAENESGASND